MRFPGIVYSKQQLCRTPNSNKNLCKIANAFVNASQNNEIINNDFFLSALNTD